MIGALKAIPFQFHKNPALFFVGDVGYSVYITNGLAKTLKPDKKVLLHIHSHIREDAFDLYGFSTLEELSLFELLITVSGIGPKTALPILERGVDAIERAVTHSDVEFFTTIPRLGKKNAQKIIIELKSKLGSLQDLNLDDEPTGQTKELMDALLSMGFVKKEILPIIKKIPAKAVTLEQKLREALLLLGT
jgi:Holliday junction DNA helicase RuvA